MKLISILLLTAGLAGCGAGAAQLSAAGKTVKAVKSDPAAECEELGFVKGDQTGYGCSGGMEAAQADLRNKAAAMGANFVRMDVATMQEGGPVCEVTGTAFKCP
jgi:hypothetical protein